MARGPPTLHNGRVLLEPTPEGLRCARGGFWIDPWAPVDFALITHAHADHARPESRRYLCAGPSAALISGRVGTDVPSVAYGERLTLDGGVTVSFHPAGHILGSAQLRIEADGEVWVVSGDYKRAPDPTCAPFEPLRCDVFVTEATFALPIYRWDPPHAVIDEIWDWWQQNRAAGRPSVLFCYSLGKAQRILAELVRHTDRAAWVHGGIEPGVAAYREAGVAMLPTRLVNETERGVSFAGELVLAPPSASGSVWMRRFAGAETAFASGWMQVRGTRRRLGYDRGFVLSDHADWTDLLATVDETGAKKILVQHGYAEPLARFLREKGRDAVALPSPLVRDRED